LAFAARFYVPWRSFEETFLILTGGIAPVESAEDGARTASAVRNSLSVWKFSRNRKSGNLSWSGKHLPLQSRRKSWWFHGHQVARSATLCHRAKI